MTIAYFEEWRIHYSFPNVFEKEWDERTMTGYFCGT